MERVGRSLQKGSPDSQGERRREEDQLTVFCLRLDSSLSSHPRLYSVGICGSDFQWIHPLLVRSARGTKEVFTTRWLGFSCLAGNTLFFRTRTAKATVSPALPGCFCIFRNRKESANVRCNHR
jgi:hypothetical protein